MKNKVILMLTVLLIISAFINVKLYSENKKEKSILPVSEMVEVDNVNTGSVKIGKIITSQENNNIITSALYYPNTPGNWHIHPKGQIIYVTGGNGYYQEENSPLRKIKAGDLIVTKPNVKSWHGSTKDSKLELITISNYSDKMVDWLDPVNIDEYNSIK